MTTLNGQLTTIPRGPMVLPNHGLIQAASAVPVFGVTEIKKRLRMIQEVMRGCMKENVHYGVIPGTPKPSLWKPGAEMLCTVFQLVPVLSSTVTGDDSEATWDFEATRKNRTTGESYIESGTCIGWFEVESVCELYAANGALLARCSARCNNRENKYRGVSVYDVRNTIQKMAEKRAMVAAVLMGTGASDIFTQDLEDMDTEGNAIPGTGKPLTTTGAASGTSSLSPKQQEAARKFGAQAGVAPAVVEFAVAKIGKGECKGFMDALFSKENPKIAAAFEGFAAALRAQAAAAPAADAKPATTTAPAAKPTNPPAGDGSLDFPDDDGPQGAPSPNGGGR